MFALIKLEKVDRNFGGLTSVHCSSFSKKDLYVPLKNCNDFSKVHYRSFARDGPSNGASVKKHLFPGQFCSTDVLCVFKR